MAAYGQIGRLLADLKEALADSKQSGLAEKAARELKRQHPTARGLAAELRKRGLIAK